MRGEKTIDLGFEVKVSRDGQFVPYSTVTVRAPGLDQYRVHSMMQGWTSEGARGFQKAYAEQIERARVEREAAGEAMPAADGADKKDEEIDVMAMMSAGLTPERYAQFAEFVLTTMKKNHRLAWVGDQPLPGTALTDHVVEQIVENGGLAALDRIFSEFAGFFMLGQGSKAKPNGDASATTSASPTKATSPAPRRVNSRLQN